MIRRFLTKALTRTVTLPKTGRGKQTVKVQIPPSQTLVYATTVAIIFFAGLLILEVIYMVVFQEFHTSIFSGIMLIVGIVLGAFFGAKS